MPPASTPLANSCLRYSAHTFGDRILCWGGGQGKWALWQFCPTTEESLKNALDYDSRLVHHLQENHLAYVSLYKK
jgi:hypothetical protein